MNPLILKSQETKQFTFRNNTNGSEFSLLSNNIKSFIYGIILTLEKSRDKTIFI